MRIKSISIEEDLDDAVKSDIQRLKRTKVRVNFSTYVGAVLKKHLKLKSKQIA